MLRPSLIFAAFLVCAGCQSPQQIVFDREAVSHCLPPDVTLETVATVYSAVDKFTIEQELIERGAHVAKDGKLRDGSGKEIRFVHEGDDKNTASANDASTQPDAEAQSDSSPEDYTIITITADPIARSGR